MEKILEEEIDENYELTVEEIIKLGVWIDLTLPDDEDLLYITHDGLKALLPPLWKRCKTREGDNLLFQLRNQPKKNESIHVKAIISN